MTPIRDFTDKVVVITGAASGIGLATALAFAREHAKLALCDIDAQPLEESAKQVKAAGATLVLTRVVSVSDAERMRDFAKEVEKELGAAEILVNNAGVAVSGSFLSTSLDDWRWLVDTNLFGVIHGCRAFLPGMLRNKHGQIVNIASAAGFFNSELLGAYGTTKYAVIGFSEALRDELRSKNVGVSVVCPGFVNTSLAKNMRVARIFGKDEYRKEVEDFFALKGHDPSVVAKAVLRAVRSNSAVLPVTREAWALYLLKRMAPSMVHRLVRALTGES